MPLLLHGISPAEADGRDNELEGVRRQPLARIDASDLRAYATHWLEGDRPELGRADLLEHHRLIAVLHQRHHACLAARFPTWFADDAALRGTLERRQAELRQAVARIRDRVELALTALWTSMRVAEPIVTAETSPGRRYLLERQRVLHANDADKAVARELVAHVNQVVGRQVLEIDEVLCPRDGVVLSMSLLVGVTDAEAVSARLRTGLPARRDLRILVNGPWPPYTFARVGATAE